MPILRRPKEIKFYLFFAALMALIAGYGDLARGGTTIAAFLLTIDYCVLIPLGIWNAATG